MLDRMSQALLDAYATRRQLLGLTLGLAWVARADPLPGAARAPEAGADHGAGIAPPLTPCPAGRTPLVERDGWLLDANDR